jgi:hypothetical protein
MIIQHNDIQHNDIQHNDTQHNDIQHKCHLSDDPMKILMKALLTTFKKRNITCMFLFTFKSNVIVMQNQI